MKAYLTFTRRKENDVHMLGIENPSNINDILFANYSDEKRKFENVEKDNINLVKKEFEVNKKINDILSSNKPIRSIRSLRTINAAPITKSTSRVSSWGHHPI